MPCYGRIPNFKGVEAATKQIFKLPEFMKSNLIFSAPDYVLHILRKIALQNGKELLLATPHIRAFLLLKDIPPRMIAKAVTIKEMAKFGTQVQLNQISTPVDIFCQGSVAVDRKGNRLGKGKGYGDQEFQLLQSEGLINPQTLIITLLHDIQLLDDFSYLMEPQDVPVQVVLTPTEIIRI